MWLQCELIATAPSHWTWIGGFQIVWAGKKCYPSNRNDLSTTIIILMRPQWSPFPPQKYIHKTVNTVIHLHLHQLFPSESTDIFGSSYWPILMKMIKLKIRIIFLKKMKKEFPDGTGGTGNGPSMVAPAAQCQVRVSVERSCQFARIFCRSTKFIAFFFPRVFHFIFKKMVINLPGKIVACFAWPKLTFSFEII